MIVHSWGSSLPGLLMISLGIAILPTSWRSAANSRLRWRSGPSAELIGEIEREPDDALAVLAGVAVVGLDHVAEHERGAAVGARQLEHALQPLVALVREHREQAEQRHQRQGGDRGGVDVLADDERDPGERRRRSRRPRSTQQRRDGCAPRGIVKRTDDTMKSATNCAASAATSSGATGVRGSTCASANTATGPIANQALHGDLQQAAGRQLAALTCRQRGDRQREQRRRSGRPPAAPRTAAGRSQLRRGREAERSVEAHQHRERRARGRTRAPGAIANACGGRSNHSPATAAAKRGARRRRRR